MNDDSLLGVLQAIVTLLSAVSALVVAVMAYFKSQKVEKDQVKLRRKLGLTRRDVDVNVDDEE